MLTRNHPKRAVAVLLTAALALTSLNGCYLLPEEEEPLAPPLVQADTIEYATVPAERGTIERTVRVTGTFVAANRKTVYLTDRGGRVSNIPVMLGQRVEEGDLLLELENDDLEFEIAKQEIAVRRARAVLNQAKSQGGYAQQIAQADYDLAKLTLDHLKAQLDMAQLTAPMGGIVTYIADMALGDYVPTSQELFTISDPSELTVECSDTAGLTVGMQIEGNYSGTAVTGTVVSTPREVPESASAEEKAKTRIAIEGDALKDKISMGDSMVFTAVIERAEDAIIIDNANVKTANGRSFVYVLEDGQKVECTVETGVQDGLKVEIKSGLEEGDLVIVQ
ncbi:MAG: efflux RND transporter periplasmic adaptor subunit [Christensenellales bacterium]|jgi:macrolide-specific efflux system membrane fusion protein